MSVCQDTKPPKTEAEHLAARTPYQVPPTKEECDELLSEHYHVVEMLAKRFAFTHPMHDYDDVISAAMILAVKLAPKFDYRKANFRTFLTFMIPKRLYSEFRAPNYRVLRFVTSVEGYMSKYFAEFGVMPNAETISKGLGVTEDTLKSRVGRHASQAVFTSLNEVNEPPDEVTTEHKAVVSTVQDVLAQLPLNTRIVANLIMDLPEFSAPAVVKAFSANYGVTKTQAEDAVSEAMRTLRTEMEQHGIAADTLLTMVGQ